MNSPRFRKYSDYLRERYGATAYRVAVDAGFSCPNRGSERRSPGCTYCDAMGSRATYSRPLTPAAETGQSRLESIRSQIESGIDFLTRRYDAKVFLLYFQAFSNTFGSAETLRNIYDYGLSLYDFRELIIATRPDCVSPSVAGLLASYINPEREVWVELGLQSACNRTLDAIGRGHTVEDFERAYVLLRDAGIRVACHLILGLPGESVEDMRASVEYVSRLRPDAVKLHDLHIPLGTAMYREYQSGELAVPTGRRYLSYLADAVERIPPETILMRISCDTPSERRAAPRSIVPKNRIYSDLTHELERRGTFQGAAYNVSD